MIAFLGAAVVSGRAESDWIPAAPAGLVETGAPSFVVLGPEAMGLSVAPTDLKVMPDGRILAVSPREIAFGDGVRWEVFSSDKEEHTIDEQVAIAPNGQLYAGIPGAIARIDFGENARWHFTRLAALPPQDPSFQNSTMHFVDLESQQWFWHAGSGVIVAWQPGAVAKSVGKFSSIGRVFTLGKEIFVPDEGSGALFHVGRGDSPTERVRAVDILSSETVTSTCSFGKGEILIGTSLAGLKVFDGSSLRVFPATGWLSGGHRISDLCPVGDGLFAAAVETIGIVIFNREGRTVQVLDHSLDHRLARAHRLLYTREGVLWALLSDGVVRVEFPSPCSHFEALVPSGLKFALPLRHSTKLWLLADGQALRGDYDATGRLERFELDSPPGRFLFTLSEVEGELIAANDEGIFVRGQAEWKMIAPGIINARIVSQRSYRQGWFYIARDEIGFLQKSFLGFSAKRIPVPNLGDNYRATVDADGIVWLEMGTSRVARVDPSAAQPTVRLFGPKDGLGDGWVEIYELDGVVHLNQAKHVFRFNEKSGRLEHDQEFTKRFPQLTVAGGRPAADKAGRIWYARDGSTRVISRSSSGEIATDEIIPGSFASSQFTVETDGIVWIFDNRRLARLDRRIKPPPSVPLRALITSVQFPVSGHQLFARDSTLDPIEYGDNSLVIRFGAPANPFIKTVSFEILLEGSSDQWVSTGSLGSASFNRLKEGNYVFRVRPVVRGEPPGIETRLEFTIEPPWFRSPLAWIMYCLAGAAVLGVAIWLPSFLQRRENERLERVVAERTKELNVTNVQLGDQIKVTTEKSHALSASEERYRSLNTELERRVAERTAELSRSHGELQQREILFRLIFEHAPLGISWKRTDLGDVYHLNSTFRRVLGLPADGPADPATLSALVHAEDAARHAELSQSIESGQVNHYDVEQRYVRTDGGLWWGRLSVAVVRDATGHIIQEIGILEDITARKQAEQDLAESNRNLVEVSRTAGMAEVATGVLHNVGNVLNSVNVSASLVGEQLRRTKAGNLAKICELLDQHKTDLGTFVTSDPKGQIIPSYLGKLAQSLADERGAMQSELDHLQKNIGHIKEIVAMQQNYARTSGFNETVSLSDLVEDALRMNADSLSRNQVALQRDFQAHPSVTLDKHKVIQILVNLVRNARFACVDSGKPDKSILVRITTDELCARVLVSDNGVGIPAENLTRIFAHGFTTRKTGHGFGLHNGALAARELGGALTVASDGPGTGATFTLELPLEVRESNPVELVAG